MKDKLQIVKEIVYANPIPAAIVFAILLLLGCYVTGVFIDKVTGVVTDRQVEKLEQKANDKIDNANSEINKAAEARGASKAEDLRRETQIKPAIVRAERNRADANAATRKAEQDYETSLQSTSDPNSDLRLLRERNCADYRDLFPSDSNAHCAQ